MQDTKSLPQMKTPYAAGFFVTPAQNIPRGVFTPKMLFKLITLGIFALVAATVLIFFDDHFSDTGR